jgi:hypothetical protein
VRCVQVLELEPSESGLNVVGHKVLLVARIGGLPERAAHGVREPAVQVLLHSQVIVIVDEALVPVRYRLSELAWHLLAVLAADVAALGTFRRLDPVGSPVADLVPVFLVWID